MCATFTCSVVFFYCRLKGQYTSDWLLGLGCSSLDFSKKSVCRWFPGADGSFFIPSLSGSLFMKSSEFIRRLVEFLTLGAGLDVLNGLRLFCFGFRLEVVVSRGSLCLCRVRVYCNVCVEQL